MKKKIPIPQITSFVLSLAALAAVRIMRDPIIINFRLKGYEMARNTTTIAVILFTVLLLIAVLKEQKRAEPEPVPEEPAKPDPDVMTEHARSCIYSDLSNYGTDKWLAIKSIKELLDQLDSMNEYQSKLDPLLDQNGYLGEKPAQIVQRLEDCMYVNIRKLLNYMSVLQKKSLSQMSAKVQECIRKNAVLMNKTDEFILAIVDYVNSDMKPGEENRTKEYVDNYMYLVLDAIKLPETYLK